MVYTKSSLLEEKSKEPKGLRIPPPGKAKNMYFIFIILYFIFCNNYSDLKEEIRKYNKRKEEEKENRAKLLKEEHDELHKKTKPHVPYTSFTTTTHTHKHSHKSKHSETGTGKKNEDKENKRIDDDDDEYEEKEEKKPVIIKKEDKVTKGIEKLKSKIKKHNKTKMALSKSKGKDKERPVTAPTTTVTTAEAIEFNNKKVDLSNDDDDESIEDIDSEMYRKELHDRLVYIYYLFISIYLL